MKEKIVSDDTMGLVFFDGNDEPRDVYRWTLTTTQEQGSEDIRRHLVIEGRDEKRNPIALVSAILHQRAEARPPMTTEISDDLILWARRRLETRGVPADALTDDQIAVLFRYCVTYAGETFFRLAERMARDELARPVEASRP